MHPSVEFTCVFSHGFEKSSEDFDGDEARHRATITKVSDSDKTGRTIEMLDGRLAAEVYDEWLLKMKHPQPGIIRQKWQEAKQKGKDVGILGDTTSYPLILLSSDDEKIKKQKILDRPLLHPSAVTAEGHIRTFAKVRKDQRIELLTANGTTLLYSIAILDELIGAAKIEGNIKGSALGSLCFFCAGCKAAVLGDKFLEEGVQALQTSFSGATDGKPFALVHPFGEQGCPKLSGDNTELPKIAFHSNLNFGSVVFFKPPENQPKQTTAPSLKRGANSQMSMKFLEAPEDFEDKGCFWFLSREYLLKATQLERFQDLRMRESFDGQILQKVKIDGNDEGDHAKTLRALDRTHCAVSHRWNQPGDPDPKGRQLKAIQDWLEKKENKGFQWVWYDYCCHPQRKKDAELEGTPDVVAHLKRIQNWTLKSVNKLYLNLHVVILLDMQYIGRFWTLFEAYLSFRRMSEDGLVEEKDEPFALLSPYSTRPRRTIISVYETDEVGHAETDASKELLEKIWRGKTVQQAYQRLAMPDIHVTNQKDKLVNLKKLRRLQRLAQQPKNAQSGESFKIEGEDPMKWKIEGSVESMRC